MSNGRNVQHILGTVTVPPRWIVEPSDVSVERNRQIALHCQAQGVPTPIIVWKKTTGEYDAAFPATNQRNGELFNCPPFAYDCN